MAIAAHAETTDESPVALFERIAGDDASFPVDVLRATVAVQSTMCCLVSVFNSGFSIAQQIAHIAISLGNNNDILYTGGLVYALTGSIDDPSTQSVKSPFNMLRTSSFRGNSQSYAHAVDAPLWTSGRPPRRFHRRRALDRCCSAKLKIAVIIFVAPTRARLRTNFTAAAHI